jgi:hypothetical protein
MSIVCPLKLRTRQVGSIKNDFTLKVFKNYVPSSVFTSSFLWSVGHTITDEVVDYSKLPKAYACNLKMNKSIFKEVTNTSIVSDDIKPFELDYADLLFNGVPYNYEIQRGYTLGRLDAYETSPTQINLDIHDYLDLKEAFTKLQPSFKDAKVDQFNVYTAILELGDLKKTFSKTAIKLGKSLGHTAAEKNLLINFGILPLFSDIQAIYGIVTRLSGYIDRWNEAAKSGLVWDKHVLVSEVVEQGELDTFVGPTYSSFVPYNVTSPNQKRTSSVKLHLYFKPKLIAESERKNVYIRALGIDKPLSGAWEAVPFSWAIDYFTNIGEIIDAFDEAIETMFQYEFVSCGYSQKSAVEGDFLYVPTLNDPGHPAYVFGSIPQPFGRSFKIERYVRRRLPLKSMFEYMSKPTEFILENNVTRWQFSYLASVAFLKTFK